LYVSFIQELNSIKAYFELHRKTPEILRSHPDYAGSAFWARSLLRRVTSSMSILQSAYYLPRTTFSDEVKELYDGLVSSLEEYISKSHADWVSSIPVNIEEKLEGTLMTHRGELLEIKFDKDLLRLFQKSLFFRR
jgi:dynein heavy chain